VLFRSNHALYTGINQFAQFFPTAHYHINPQFGALLNTKRFDIQIEYKWLSLYRNNANTTAEFVGPFGQGASSIQLGIGFHLGKAGGAK
jgi:hypothetical protein